jgi:hypothetical protein
MIRRPTRKEFNSGSWKKEAKDWPEETVKYLGSLQYIDFVAALEMCDTPARREELMKQKLLFSEGKVIGGQGVGGPED